MREGVIVVKIPKRWGIRRRQGFAFDMYTWCYMSEYTQLAMDDFDKLEGRTIIVTYYCAAYSYNLQYRKRCNFTEDDVKRWFDDMPQKTAQKILNTMLKSKVGGETMEDLIARSSGGEKKK